MTTRSVSPVRIHLDASPASASWRAYMKLTTLAHTIAEPRLAPGDLAVDATAGNGHDTRFLAKHIGEHGRVWAFDIQEAALASTRKRLVTHGLTERVTLVHASNATLRDHLPVEARSRISVIMANLGYLPGGDPAVITATGETLTMLNAALEMLKPGGALILTAYPGHEGGDTEAAAVFAQLKAMESHGHQLSIVGAPLDPARRPWLATMIKHGTTLE